MRVNEAAKKLRVNAATVREAVREGKIRASQATDPKLWPHGLRDHES